MGATRIMELRNENFELKVVQGLNLRKGIKKELWLRDFCRIIPLNTPDEELKMELAYEISVEDVEDSFKDVKINNVVGENKLHDEDTIMLILQMMPGISITLLGSTKKIAGRFMNEGIFLLKSGDGIVVKFLEEENLFTAVKINQHMYLVKEY